MKYAADRPYSDPEKAARRLMQHAHAFEVVQDGRIYIEKINGPFLYVDRATPGDIRRALRSPSNVAGLNSTTAAPSSASRNPARTCSPEELARPVESQHHPVDRDYGKGRTSVGSFRFPTGHPVGPVSD